MKVRLLRRVQKVMRAEPRRANMDEWARGPQTFDIAGGITGIIPKHKRPECGTVGCIYGWIKALTTKTRANELVCLITRQRPYGLIADGAKLLDISDYQAEDLFLPRHWPLRFYSRLQRHKYGTKAYVEVICDRIDYFIATRGTDDPVKFRRKPRKVQRAA